MVEEIRERGRKLGRIGKERERKRYKGSRLRWNFD